MRIVVSALAVTPVKGTQIQHVEQIELAADGARGNRRFFIVDERNRMVNGKQLGELQSVVAACEDGMLRFSFPDGRVVEDLIELGEEQTVRFFSYPRKARRLHGPWNEALSAHVGRAVHLFDGGPATDRGQRGTVSLISRESLTRLAERAGQPEVDSRRFRMLVEIDGVAAHEEDRWAGREVRIGATAVRFNGHVGRCLVTSRDPETGRIDLPTLDILGDYRRDLLSTEPLPFGIYGEVLRPGTVRVGDSVEPVQ
jgi:uncharacterized protein YcbX